MLHRFVQPILFVLAVCLPGHAQAQQWKPTPGQPKLPLVEVTFVLDGEKGTQGFLLDRMKLGPGYTPLLGTADWVCGRRGLIDGSIIQPPRRGEASFGYSVDDDGSDHRFVINPESGPLGWNGTWLTFRVNQYERCIVKIRYQPLH